MPDDEDSQQSIDNQSGSQQTPQDQSQDQGTTGDQSQGQQTPQDQSQDQGTTGDQSQGQQTPQDQSQDQGTAGDQSQGEGTTYDQSQGKQTIGDQVTSQTGQLGAAGSKQAFVDTQGTQTQTVGTAGSGSTDSEGFKLLDFGTWNASATLNYRGGQVMHFAIKNVNVLGTTITIDSNLGGSKTAQILPQATADMRFTVFGSEPMGWSFSVSTNSDAFIVAWKLYSSWIPGDPPNR